MPEKTAISQRLCDITEIREQLAAHSRGVDRADGATLKGAYHVDASVAYGFFNGAAHEFADILTGAQTVSPLSLHRTAQSWIKLSGRCAVSESYVMAFASGEDDGQPVQRIIGGRYLDRWSERDGHWKIDHRTYVMDFNINLPGTTPWPDPGTPLSNAVPRGGHGDADVGRALMISGYAKMQQAEDNKMMQSSEERLAQALDRIELNQLMAKYTRGVDRCDVDLLREIFTDDANVISGAYNGDGAGFPEAICDIIKQNIDRSYHSVANHWVEVKGDRAVGEIYCVATTCIGDVDSIVAGRYLNEYRRENGQWRISSHVWVQDWGQSTPGSHSNEGMYEALDVHGSRDRTDPVYALWEGL